MSRSKKQPRRGVCSRDCPWCAGNRTHANRRAEPLPSSEADTIHPAEVRLWERDATSDLVWPAGYDDIVHMRIAPWVSR